MTKQGERVLVAYSSRLGSTREVAEFIGRVLSDGGYSVDVRAIDAIDDLAHYGRVVIGSAIRYDRWLADAAAFVAANRQALQRVPVALFFLCLALSSGSASGVRQADRYANRVSSLLDGVKAADVGRFAGVLSLAKAPWWTRLALRAISLVTGVKEGDYRNWAVIRSWSERLLASKAS